MRGKKRHKSDYKGKGQKNSQPAQTGSRKKFKPLPLKILILDLVFLAVIQMLADGEMITEMVGSVATVAGAIALMIALYVQLRD